MSIRLSDHFTLGRLLRFTLPAMLMMVFTSLYGVVDGLFITNFAGKTALAAVNFVFPLLNILATVGYMFGAGGGAIIAMTMGEGHDALAKRRFSLFVYTSMAVSAVMSGIGFLVLEPVMYLLGARGEMLSLAVTYGYILLPALPFWNLQYLFQLFLATAERPRLGLYVTLLAGFANMGLDALLVGVLDAGIGGAALATAISQLLGGGVPLLYFFSNNTSRLRLGRTTVEWRVLGHAIGNGSSEFVAGVSSSLVGLLFNTQLMLYAGEDGVAAYGVMMYVGFMFVGLFIGLCNGSAPIIGFHYGAQNTGELRSVFRKLIGLLLIGSGLMCVLSQLLAHPICTLYTGYDPALLDMTLGGFRVFALHFLFAGLAIFGSSFFTALGNGLISALLALLRTVVFQVGFVLLLPLVLGLDGIWWSITLAEASALVAAVLCLILKRRTYGYA